MVNLGDVEPTNAVAFAISKLISLDVVGVSFGDGHGVLLGHPVLALVVHMVARRILYLVHYLFVCHHNFFFVVWGFPHRFKQYSRLFLVVNRFIYFFFMLPLEGDFIPFEWFRLAECVVVALGAEMVGGVITWAVKPILWGYHALVR